MRFGLAQYTSQELDLEKSGRITDFDHKLREYLADKNYGDGIKSLAIGVICMHSKFATFFRSRAPKYTKNKTILKGDIDVEIERSFEYDIRLDFESFIGATEESAKHQLAFGILESFKNFDQVKIADFDLPRFKKDMEEYLIQFIKI